jgi:putative oxidoreductase
MLNKWLDPYANWANFILRSFVGVIFCAHGVQQLFGVFGGPRLDATARMFEQYGLVPGELWALGLGIVELLGGIMLIAGLFTRYAALVLSAVMAGVIFVVHLPNGFFLPNGVEFAFALLAANVTLLVGGPGALALDGWIVRHRIFAVRHEKAIRHAA